MTKWKNTPCLSSSCSNARSPSEQLNIATRPAGGSAIAGLVDDSSFTVDRERGLSAFGSFRHASTSNTFTRAGHFSNSEYNSDSAINDERSANRASAGQKYDSASLVNCTP